MTIDELRCALRGVAAYRHIVDAPLMGLTLELLDRLASGDGTGAVERYARLFYELRQAGLNVPLDALSVDECAQAIAKALKEPSDEIGEPIGTDH